MPENENDNQQSNELLAAIKAQSEMLTRFMESIKSDFRENNVNLRQRNERLEGRTQEEVSFQETIDDLKEEIKTEREARQAAEGRANQSILTDKIREVGGKMNMQKGAERFILPLAASAGLEIKDGVPVFRDNQEMTVKKWMGQFKKDTPYLFDAGRGNLDDALRGDAFRGPEVAPERNLGEVSGKEFIDSLDDISTGKADARLPGLPEQ